MPLALGALAVLSCWYMSLQHELLHGHPTRFPLVNALFGIAPLAVWFPYAVYRESHLRHHDDDHLTDPGPRSRKLFRVAGALGGGGPGDAAVARAAQYVRRPRAARAGVFDRGCVARRRGVAVARGDVPRRRRAGRCISRCSLRSRTGSSTAAAFRWFAFMFGVGYPALALGAVRSFHEHRAVDDAPQRTVINEAGWFWRLLFLNNNYHAVHHDLPGVPWFALGTVYHRRRDGLCRANGRVSSCTDTASG